MWTEIFLRELKGGLRQPMVYIFFALFGALTMGAQLSDNISIGGAVGNVHQNAPHIITIFTSILSIFGLLVATAFFNNAAQRDFQYNFHQILFTTPLPKGAFFWGRFLGALALASIPLTGIFLGAIISTLIGPPLGWVEPDQLGPIPWEAFGMNFLLFILPNMFIAGSLIFGLAAYFRSTIVAFVGTMIIIVGYLVAQNYLSDIENETIGALTDMFGISAYQIAAKYYTPLEKNTLAPSFSGLMLQNRLIWLAFGGLVSLLGYRLFSFREKAKASAKAKSKAPKSAPRPALPKPSLAPQFSGGLGWKQFVSFASIQFFSILRSPVYRILLVFNVILVVSSLANSFDYFGLQSYPVTYKVLDTVSSNSFIFMLITLVFFSGEMIWREREVNIAGVVDATPHQSLHALLAKVTALVGILAIMQLVAVGSGILWQLAHGFTQLKLDVYLVDFFLKRLLPLSIWACVMVTLQVLINQKYIAYFISILLFFFQGQLLSLLDWSSNMLRIGGKPSLMYSDMNGFGPGLEGALWFMLYWLLLGGLLLLFAGMMRIRGQALGFLQRLKAVPGLARSRFALPLSVIGLVWAGVAGWVYYNTLVLNDITPSDVAEKQRADYEKQYRRYADKPLPRITAVTYHIDIFPETHDLDVRAEMRLQNKGEQPVDSLFYSTNTARYWHVDFSIPGAQEAFRDTVLGFRAFALAEPLMPGETLDIEITNQLITRGFGNEVNQRLVVHNGTFFNNRAVLPFLGYSEQAELSSKEKRREYGLPEKDRMPALQANCQTACEANYLTLGRADWVEVETYISTIPSQIAVAPGSLEREWTENGRRHFHYTVDHPSQDFYSFISAEYEVARKKWKGRDLEVYYHPDHDYNIEKMLLAMERSLTYYTEHFAPYEHQQARILEFPRYSTFAQAFPGTMPYSESLGFIVNLEDTTKNNVVEAIIAHEMAHQWWAHQEVSAHMQGATMLTESFSEYSSLMTMKQNRDPLKMKQFVKYDHDRYLRGRGFERRKELPLYKVENQGYIHYGKGAVVLYALQEYIGAELVNGTLREFLDGFRYEEPPYPRSLDFLEVLEAKTPDSMQYALDQWFREITLYDLRVTEARLKNLEDGRYQVEMDVEAHTITADSLGHERRKPMAQWVDIGAFGDDAEEDLIHRQRVKLSGREAETLTFVTDQKPAKVGIDPLRLLIERVVSDNIVRIEAEETNQDRSSL